MAYKVIRRSLSTGVAIAGVSAITWSAIAVLPADEPVAVAHRVVTAKVTPVALASSLQLLAEAAAATLQQSADGLITKLPALWNQVNVQWADADLTHWNYALVADSFLMPVAPLVFGPLNDAVAEVVARAFPVIGDEIRAIPGMVEYGVIRLIGPILSAIGGAGAAHAQIFYSMSNWELRPFVEALVAAPGHVIGGLLFGGYGDLRPLLTGEVGGLPIPAPGLLTPWGQQPAPRDIKWAPDAPGTVVESDTLVDELSEARIVEGEIVAEPVTEAIAELVKAVEPAAELVEPVEAEETVAEETPTEETPTEETPTEGTPAEGTPAEGAETSTPAKSADEAATDTKEAQKTKDAEKTESAEKADKTSKSSRRSEQRTNADRTGADANDRSARKRLSE